MRPQVGGGACPGKRGEWLCLNGMQPCHSQGVQCLPLMQGVMKMVLPVLLLALAAPVPAFAQAPAAPTFAKDVAPILQRSCQNCHRPGSIAPVVTN